MIWKFAFQPVTKAVTFELAFNSQHQSLNDFEILDQLKIAVLTALKKVTIIDAFTHTKLKEVEFSKSP